MAIDFDAVAMLMRQAAATAVLPRFRQLSPGDVRQKEHAADLVTIADEEAERILSQGLQELLPGSQIVGEEAAAGDSQVLGRLGGSAPVWLIDPIDGTQNYVEGKDRFAVIVGLCQERQTIAGWILDPVADTMVWAGLGAGAWTDAGRVRRRLTLTRGRPLADLTGSLDYRSARRLQDQRNAGLSPSPSLIARQRCTGREYMDLGAGVLDFAQYRRLKPWDHAAGVLIHAEAGGFSRLRAGIDQAYRPEPWILEAALLLAPDESAWSALDCLLP